MAPILGRAFHGKEGFREFSSFGGADIVATLSLPGVAKPYIIGELEAISYSIFRETMPIRVTGYAAPRGFARSGRTISGTMVFMMLDRHMIRQFQDDLKQWWYEQWGEGAPPLPALRMDAMPAFNVTITASNEYGNRTATEIRGVVIVDEGQVARVDQFTTDVSMKYLAQDIVPWTHELGRSLRS